ncbi:uncharacterized protein DEA37_0014721, partial [Paragonimus westermani]
GWDSLLEETDRQIWENCPTNISSVKSLRVPQVFSDIPTTMGIELHLFGDASKTKHGAVVYIRLTASSGSIKCSSTLGQSKVVQHKTITVPRPQLTAAVLTARQMPPFVGEMRMHIDLVILETDSAIVLRYIFAIRCRALRHSL